MIGLDATDWKILRLLQGNGRISNTELAAQIHRSESACHRRVRCLEAEGVIESYAAVLNQAAIGRPTDIFVEITLVNQSEDSLDDFEAAVRECPEVRDCYFMTGDSDYLLHVAAADTADFERIYKAYLSRFPGVARIRSSFALRTITKNTAYSENHT